MKEKGPDVPAQWVVPTGSNEINFRELVQMLWRQKLLIVLIAGIFTVGGISYALLAPQQWSASAVVAEPKPEDMTPMLKVLKQATALGLSRFPSGKDLYQEFIQEFNSYENRRDYLKASLLFAEVVKKHGLDGKAQVRWLRDWSKSVTAQPVDKKGEVPGVELKFSAPTSEMSLAMLEGYIDYVVLIQQKQLRHRLDEQRGLQLDGMKTEYLIMQEDTKRALQQEILELAMANKVAKAAGVSAPLENYNVQDRLLISLGSKGLEEKLSLLKSIDLEVYQPKLQSLQAKMARLKSISLEGIAFRPFSYLDAPDEALSRDKPKRPLIVVLATLLGGMLGVGIVLIRHAFCRPEEA
ncbi:LPS O-antigen chain length determinant protein WzzB [Aeromonas hydrophila]|uniref:LPS O-antigen chain length determinant protein WzzB n=1 Tax=Aeromonas hydrophila TaxID=644 RepID=UPI00209EFF88|nr:Wzz/FepE/Etk N-terminal domain-containing protein [Aeromonas hydrophila]MCP1265096.1 Wzz/FepE/Etk N-terminal domain-containing protein [Aeromonas hydrophila]MCP1293605.1 Wzz/FepE/Etk N-terminal domain-containing protein [Aeromonas hydrophila]